MERLVEKFSRFAASNVVLIYLLAMSLGTATYFVGRYIGLSPNFVVVIGFATAAAVEVHSLLSQRLARRLWQQRNKLDQADEEYESIDSQFRIHMWITVGLVAFSIFNAWQFWRLTYPAVITAWDVVAITIRAAFIPCAFLSAGFLVPLEYDAGMLLSDASHKMLRRTIKITISQWNRRISRARKQNIDLAPIAIALMEHAGHRDGARRVQMIATGLNVAEGREAVAYALSEPPLATAIALNTAQMPTDRPPTGPGSPSLAPRPRAKGTVATGSRKVTQLRSGRPRKERRTAYERVADYLAEHPAASVRTVAEGARVSLSTASKYRNQFLATRHAEPQRQQVAQ